MLNSFPFAASERGKSSAWRELSAVYRFYAQNAAAFAHQRVVHLTDNRSVESIVSKGSPVPELQAMALALFRICRVHGTLLQAVWLPRLDPRMVLADTASRCFDGDDWGPTDDALSRLQQAFGGVTFFVDLFASDANARCATFFSLVPSVRAAGHDAFAQDWAKTGFFYACPPPSRVAATLQHAAACGARGVLLAPVWRSAAFWPLICPDGVHACSMAQQVVVCRPELRVGAHITNRLFARRTAFPFVAISLDGRVPHPFAVHPSLRV